MHAFCNFAYLLPFLIGKGGLMPTLVTLVFVDDRTSLVSRSRGCVEFIAQKGVNGVSGKQSLPVTLTPCAIASGVDLIRDFFGLNAAHT